jgi:hypothetical protein
MTEVSDVENTSGEDREEEKSEKEQAEVASSTRWQRRRCRTSGRGDLLEGNIDVQNAGFSDAIEAGGLAIEFGKLLRFFFLSTDAANTGRVNFELGHDAYCRWSL